MTQLELLDMRTGPIPHHAPPDEPREPDSLWRAVLSVMSDGRAWTTWDLGDEVRRRLGHYHTDEAIAAARRTLRRPSRGSHRITKFRVGAGQTWAYRLER